MLFYPQCAGNYWSAHSIHEVHVSATNYKRPVASSLFGSANCQLVLSVGESGGGGAPETHPPAHRNSGCQRHFSGKGQGQVIFGSANFELLPIWGHLLVAPEKSWGWSD